MNSWFKILMAMSAVALQLTTNNTLFAADTPDDDTDLHHDIEEVTVTASPLRRTVEELAQPTSVLFGDDLAKKAAASIGETVSQELGVSSSYFGPVASRPVIRGQFGPRVQVLSNGLDALDASALSEDHQATVESILAESIEIVRGPATLLYGSGASGGLVNITDRRIVESVPEKAVEGTLALNADSAIEERAGAGWIQFGNRNLSAHFDFFRRETKDVEIPGFAESAFLRRQETDAGDIEDEAFGIIENTDSMTDGGAVGLTARGEKGYIGISASIFDSNYGVPGSHSDDPNAEPEAVRIDVEQTRVDLAGEYELSGIVDKLRFRLVASDYDHVELEGDEIGTVLATDGTDLRLELTQTAWRGLEGVFGLQFNDSAFDAIGEEAFVPPSDTERLSAFVYQEYAVSDQLTLQGSARLERQKISGSELSVSYSDNAFGASLGAIVSLPRDMSIAGHLSIGERHPNATELYADGPHVAVQRFERGSIVLGNGILRKETSTNVDVTWRGNSERIDWSVTAFLNDVDDYVGLLPTAGEADGFQIFEYSQFGAEFAGIEAEMRIELFDIDGRHLHGRVHTDFVRAERDNGDALPRIPAHRFGVDLHYSVDSFELSANVVHVSEQDRLAIGELPTNSYTLLSLDASYALEDHGVFVFARLSNLTDEDARHHASPLKDTVPLPGRSIHAGIRWHF